MCFSGGLYSSHAFQNASALCWHSVDSLGGCSPSQQTTLPATWMVKPGYHKSSCSFRPHIQLVTESDRMLPLWQIHPLSIMPLASPLMPVTMVPATSLRGPPRRSLPLHPASVRSGHPRGQLQHPPGWRSRPSVPGASVPASWPRLLRAFMKSPSAHTSPPSPSQLSHTVSPARHTTTTFLLNSSSSPRSLPTILSGP